jgi:lipoprotein-anchoring transpeptidase ErfK/SrfK
MLLLGAAVASALVLAGAGLTLSRSGVIASGGRARLDVSSSTPKSAAAPSLARAADIPRLAEAAGNAAASEVMPAPASRVTPAGAGPLVLTPAQRSACPAAAVACVNLTSHVTWLQDGGKVTFGPVRMEPGTPGTSSATPRGTFHIQWKANANFVSNEFNEAMPWATFFAPGGIAFHGGSLTKPSHGCVHLTTANAKYFHDHLLVGAEVAVF